MHEHPHFIERYIERSSIWLLKGGWARNELGSAQQPCYSYPIHTGTQNLKQGDWHKQKKGGDGERLGFRSLDPALLLDFIIK